MEKKFNGSTISATTMVCDDQATGAMLEPHFPYWKGPIEMLTDKLAEGIGPRRRFHALHIKMIGMGGISA